MADSQNLVKKLMSLGEERMTEVMDELLSNEKVSGVVSKALSRTQNFKAVLDKNVSLAMSLLNQPTREDYDKLRKQIRHLERTVEDLGEKLDDAVKAAAKTGKKSKGEE